MSPAMRRPREALKTRQDAVPVVRAMEVKTDQAPRVVDLPGTMQAFDSATLYARATGYIGKRNVDIGSRVHAGDVLAIITAPDLDQQLAQARAQLAQMQAALLQAQAGRSLAAVTNQRTSRLVVGRLEQPPAGRHGPQQLPLSDGGCAGGPRPTSWRSRRR